MPSRLTEDEIDDLLYFARVSDWKELIGFANECCTRDSTSFSELFFTVKDSNSGNGPLHMAAANGHTEVLSEVIKVLSVPTPQNPPQLAILNAQNAAGNTALHWAALNGHLDCVKVLIDSGADPTIRNGAGHDAVYEAELNDKKEVVEWVLKEAEGLEEGIGRDGEAEEEEDEAMGEDQADRKLDGVQTEDEVGAGLRDLSMKDETKNS